MFITEWVARALDRDEREAVLGDLAESGASELRRFFEVAGLVLRRQSAEWRHVRPWLALVFLIAPLGLFLSGVSKFTAQQTAVYLWLYANNTNWDLLHNRGFWYELGSSTLLLSGIYLKLACWSWASGLILGYVTRKTRRAGYSSLVLTLFAGTICASMYLPQYLEWVLRGRFPQNLPLHEDPVAQVFFYRSLLPIITELLIVAVPAISAMRHAHERFSSVSGYAVVWLSIVVVVDMLLHNSILWIELWGEYSMKVAMTIPHSGVWSLIVYWPAVYLMLASVRQRQRLVAG